MGVTRWAEMTDKEKEALLDWVKQTCLVFGVSRTMAYQVASMFAEGLDRETAEQRRSA